MMNGLFLQILFLFEMIWDVDAHFSWLLGFKCPDEYTLTIKHLNWKCVRKDCPPGYFGDFCENRCRFPHFGKNCQYICDCSKNYCDVIKGCSPPFPHCPDGYLGKYCETKCRYPSYGHDCQQECSCSKVQCNIVTGCQIYTKAIRMPKFSTQKRNNKEITNPTLRDTSSISQKIAAIPSASATGAKDITQITGGKIFREINESLSADGMKEVKAQNQLEEMPAVNMSIFWSIIVFAVLTVPLVIGHIYLTVSKKLQRSAIQS